MRHKVSQQCVHLVASTGVGALLVSTKSAPDLESTVNSTEQWYPSFDFWSIRPRTERWLVTLLLFLSCGVSSWAVDPGRHITQYAHGVWTTRDGSLNGAPVVVAQTKDGVLWVGTNLGLMRFDGVHFTNWEPPNAKRFLDPRITALIPARDGSLWIGTAFSVAHWKDGTFVVYPKVTGRIESMAEAPDGSLWVVRTEQTDDAGPLCHLRDSDQKCYKAGDGIPFTHALQIANAGSEQLWVGGYSELCLWKPGSCRSFFGKGPRGPDTFASVRAIAVDKDATAWAAIDSTRRILELQHFVSGHWTAQLFPQIPVSASDIDSLFVDRDGALWIATAHHGIYRTRDGATDHFGKEDGLSSDAVGYFYQDHEGNIWVTTSEGIDNFRDLEVTSFSMAEGLTAAAPGSLIATHDGSIWLANFHALDRLRDGTISSIQTGKGLPGRNTTTLLEDHAGRIWVGIDDGLWVYERNSFRSVRRRDGSPVGVVFSLAEDPQRDIWARAGTKLYRIQNFKVQEELASPQISTCFVIASNPRGGIYLGLVNGDLIQLQDGTTRTLPSNETGNTAQIRDLFVERDGSVWGNTVEEVVRWRDGVRRNLTTANGLPCRGIFALVKDQRDALWLYSRCGLVQIEKQELENWWQHPDTIVKFKLFDISDGVQAALTSLKPQAVRSPDGRLWFVNAHLLQEIDPDHLHRNEVLPPVTVTRIIADRKEYAPEHGGLIVPPLTRELQIDYTAFSFVSPEKVRFRYLLEGHDVNWQEAGSRRQAFFNDLRPGSYRFRVMASNSDGIWNEQGASLDFNIAPAWYQTAVFRSLVVIFCALAAWSLYRLRIRRLAESMSARFDVRLAERTRLARELHDTFLQTIQGSKLLADDVLEHPADQERMRRAMELLSNWLDRATREGRDALNSLRSSTKEKNDLAQALRRATENGIASDNVTANLSVVGEAREMHPIVRDEVYRIAYEAIRNAYAHSRGTQLDIELRYARDLTIRVKDNGVGIDPDTLGVGKDLHFGLQGMRERAARIGGKLSLVSSPGSGTEVVLVVPGGIVFRTAPIAPSSKFRELFDAMRNKNPE